MRAPGRIALGAAALAVLGAVAAAQVNISSPAPVKDQVVSSGNLVSPVGCDSSALLTVSTATTTQIVALVAAKSIYICGFVMNGGGTTTAKLVTGTGTNCATGQTNLTPAFSLAVASSISAGSGLGYLIKTAAGAAVCVTNSAAQNANVLVIYTQF